MVWLGLYDFILMATTTQRIGIVCSTFNEPYVGSLLKHCLLGLAGQTCDVIRVPGSYEIPLQVQRMAKSKKYGAVIALGMIWTGKTAHASEILRAVTDSLMSISLATNVPVIHQVLSVSTEKEAKKRTTGKKLNRGKEAAEAALSILAAAVKTVPSSKTVAATSEVTAPTKAKVTKVSKTTKKPKVVAKKVARKVAKKVAAKSKQANRQE